MEEERGHIIFLNGGQVFRITGARVSDTGLYNCTAINVVGQSHKVGCASLTDAVYVRLKAKRKNLMPFRYLISNQV